MIAEAEGGAGWQREWIQLWVQGDVTTNVAGLCVRGTAAQFGRTDKASSLDGPLVMLAEGVMIDAVFKKLNKILHATQFSGRTQGCGGSDWSPETEELGGRRRSSGGYRSQQCVWQHVETVCVGSCADSPPIDAGNMVHAVGKRKWLQSADGLDPVERGARHVARRACWQPNFLRRAPLSVAENKEEDREWTRRRDAKGDFVN